MKAKLLGYRFNFAAVPKVLEDKETGNALLSFIAGMTFHFGGISLEAYDQLPDWAKRYWVGVTEEEAKDGE